MPGGWPGGAGESQAGNVDAVQGVHAGLADDPDGDGLLSYEDPYPYDYTNKGSAPQESYTPKQQGIKNWPLKWKIKFNPPVISYASGTRVHRERGWGRKADGGRDEILDPGNQAVRVRRKGWLVPDTTFSTDWLAQQEGVEDTAKLAKNSLIDISLKQPTIYGFKFMYNPTVIDFNVSTYDGVNIGYIYSGKSTALPTGVESSGSMINVSFPITRVDDMQAIKAQYTKMRVYNGSSIRNETVRTYSVEDAQALYGKPGAFNVDADDIKGIAERGTMYDLEYLFRATLGRQWKTVFRGQTADVGIVFSVPLKLYLADKMVYRVRMRGISFTHRSFTPDMVPLYTDVSLSFERIPDVIGVV